MMKSNLLLFQVKPVNQSTNVRFGQSACFSFDRNVHLKYREFIGILW